MENNVPSLIGWVMEESRKTHTNPVVSENYGQTEDGGIVGSGSSFHIDYDGDKLKTVS